MPPHWLARHRLVGTFAIGRRLMRRLVSWAAALSVILLAQAAHADTTIYRSLHHWSVLRYDEASLGCIAVTQQGKALLAFGLTARGTLSVHVSDATWSIPDGTYQVALRF